MAQPPAPMLMGSGILDRTPKHISQPRSSHPQDGVKPILEPGCAEGVVECLAPHLWIVSQS